MWLASDHFDFRGDDAVAGAWLRRGARRSCATARPAPSTATSSLIDGRHRALGARRSADRAGQAREAIELARGIEDVGVEVVGATRSSAARSSPAATVEEGLRGLDECAALAVAEDFAEIGRARLGPLPHRVGVRDVGDFGRAAPVVPRAAHVVGALARRATSSASAAPPTATCWPRAATGRRPRRSCQRAGGPRAPRARRWRRRRPCGSAGCARRQGDRARGARRCSRRRSRCRRRSSRSASWTSRPATRRPAADAADRVLRTPGRGEPPRPLPGARAPGARSRRAGDHEGATRDGRRARARRRAARHAVHARARPLRAGRGPGGRRRPRRRAPCRRGRRRPVRRVRGALRRGPLRASCSPRRCEALGRADRAAAEARAAREALARSARDPQADGAIRDELSPREIEILRLVARGARRRPDRRAAVPQPAHGAPPRREHPHEAPHAVARRRRRLRHPARPALPRWPVPAIAQDGRNGEGAAAARRETARHDRHHHRLQRRRAALPPRTAASTSPADPAYEDSLHAVQHDDRAPSALRRGAARRRRRRRRARLRARARPPGRRARRRPLRRRPVAVRRRRRPRPAGDAPTSRSTPTAASPASAAARSGPTSTARRRRTASPPPAGACRRPASPDSRSAVAPAGWSASTAWPATTSSPPSSSPGTAASSARRRTSTPSCSGRCAAAAGASAWSPRSSSSCTRSVPRSSAASRSSRSSAPRRSLRVFRDVMHDAPDELSLAFAILTAPAETTTSPRTCAAARSSAVIGMWAGDVADGEAALAPIRALGPEADFFGVTNYADFQCSLDDPPGYRNWWTAENVIDLPDEAIERIASARRRHPGRAVVHLHRRLGRPGALASARSTRRWPAASRASSSTRSCSGRTRPTTRAASRTPARSRSDMEPWSTGATYPNFLGEEGTGRMSAAYGVEHGAPRRREAGVGPARHVPHPPGGRLGSPWRGATGA